MALSKLNGNVSHGIDVVLGTDNAALNDKQLSVNDSFVNSFKFGSGNAQANKIYSAKVSIAASATLSLDLDDSSLKDAFGNGLNFANIKSIRISHAGDSAASSVNLLGDFMTTRFGASFSAPLPAGASFAYADNQTGLAVTASTGDVIEILNNDGSNAADVIIDLIGV